MLNRLRQRLSQRLSRRSTVLAGSNVNFAERRYGKTLSALPLLFALQGCGVQNQQNSRVLDAEDELATKLLSGAQTTLDLTKASSRSLLSAYTIPGPNSPFGGLLDADYVGLSSISGVTGHVFKATSDAPSHRGLRLSVRRTLIEKSALSALSDKFTVNVHLSGAFEGAVGDIISSIFLTCREQNGPHITEGPTVSATSNSGDVHLVSEPLDLASCPGDLTVEGTQKHAQQGVLKSIRIQLLKVD